MLPVLMTRAGSPSRGTGVEHGYQRAGQHEDALDVDVHHLVESRLGELAQWRSPGGAGVVEQRVDRVLSLGEVGDQRVDPLDRAQVGRDRLDRPVSGQFGDGGVQLGLFPAGQVHARAGLQQSARDHQPDAATATGDDGDLAVEAKQVCHGATISVLTVPSGDSTRVASSRIRPRSSAVLNSAAISLALRRPLGRSQR